MKDKVYCELELIASYRQLLERVLFDETGRYTCSVIAASLEGIQNLRKPKDERGNPEPPLPLATCLTNLASAAREVTEEARNEIVSLLESIVTIEGSNPLGHIESDILGHKLADDAPADIRRLWGLQELNTLIEELQLRAANAARAAEEEHLDDSKLCRLVALGAVIMLGLIAPSSRYAHKMLGRKQLPEDEQLIAKWDVQARKLREKGCWNIWITLAREFVGPNGTPEQYKSHSKRIRMAVTRHRNRPC